MIIGANGEDSVVWRAHLSGQYSRRHLENIKIKLIGGKWCGTRGGCVPKQSFILWMACKNKLLTREKLRRWGFIDDDSCVLCHNGVEIKLQITDSSNVILLAEFGELSRI